MATNGKKKGKNGELEIAKIFREYGFEEARRSQQYAGINHDADVVGLPNVHVEVKRVEQLNIEKAVQQMLRDKRDEEIGIVTHRRNREDWKVTMTMDDFMEIYKRYLITLEN